MPLYDICTDGVNALFQRRPTAKRLVRREPLVGVVDGSNTVFLTSHRPVLYESVAVYTSVSPATPIFLLNVDADGGVIRMPAPSIQPVADYTHLPLTSQQIAQIAWSGFDLMQALFARALRLSSNSTTYVQANPTDGHIYIVTVNADDTVADPVCGSLHFSTSPRQRAFLAWCIEYAFLNAALSDAALSDVAIRERFGGIAIDPMRRASNIQTALAQLKEDLLRAMYAAMDEVDADSEQYGAFVSPPHTDEYVDTWQWQAEDNAIRIQNWIRW